MEKHKEARKGLMEVASLGRVVGVYHEDDAGTVTKRR